MYTISFLFLIILPIFVAALHVICCLMFVTRAVSLPFSVGQKALVCRLCDLHSRINVPSTCTNCPKGVLIYTYTGRVSYSQRPNKLLGRMLANRVLQLGNRTKLPGTSKVPMWLCFFSLNLILYAGIVVAMHQIDDFKYYYVAGCLGAILIIDVIVMQLLVANRINSLAAMLQQDPHVIVGDPQCVEKLSTMACVGLSEIDCLQVAIFQTYNAYAMDARRMGKSEKVSHASDYSDVEWKSAESADEDQPDALQDYLLSQSKRRPGSRLRKIFNRSAREGSVFSCRSDESPPFFSARSNEGGLVSKRNMSPTRTPELGPSVNADALATASTSAVAISVPHVPPAWDPLDDNTSSWDILQRGIKDPGGSFLIQLLGQVRVGQPLSAVTLPVHILESRSLLERISDTCVHWEFLLPLASGKITDKHQKLISVFKWFIAAYRMKPIGARKPYNPILGEVFHCIFPPMGCDGTSTGGESAAQYVPPPQPSAGSFSRRGVRNASMHSRPPAGTSTSNRDGLEFIAEQVSHHPPVSALYARYKDMIEICGVYHPRSKLVSLNCAASLATGSIMLKILSTGDSYHISWPSFFATGIVKGDPRLELGGTVVITDQDTGVHAKVEFLRKGWLGGEFDKMECQIYGQDKQPIVKYGGTWFDVISNSLSGEVFHDPRVVAHLAPRPRVIETPNHPKQSRGVWKDLTIFVRDGDAAGAGAAKHKVESAQRVERKKMADDGKEFTPEFFRFFPPKKGAKKGVPRSSAEDAHQHVNLNADEDAQQALEGAKGFKLASDDDKYDINNWRFIGQKYMVIDQESE